MEGQGRGTLHLHLLLWLLYALGPAELFAKLREPDFVRRFFVWLDSLIVQHVPTRSTEPRDSANAKQILSSAQRLCERPHDPAGPDFAADVKDCLASIVPAVQLHSRQHTSTCFKFGDECRFRYPRDLVDGSHMDEQHLIKLARSHPWVVGFVPLILYCCRCNMDIRALFSGRDALSVIRYVTDYVTKPQKKFDKTFPVIAAAVRTLETRPEFKALDRNSAAAAPDIARRMVVRCLNKLAGESLKSGPEVAASCWDCRTTTAPRAS